MTSVVYVTADDWEGVYVNGLLAEQGHRIDSQDWKRLLKYGWQEWYEYDISDNCEWLHEEGFLPDALWEFYRKAGFEGW